MQSSFHYRGCSNDKKLDCMNDKSKFAEIDVCPLMNITNNSSSNSEISNSNFFDSSMRQIPERNDSQIDDIKDQLTIAFQYQEKQ